MITYSPDNWPAGAPPYYSAEGWEHQKMLQRTNLKTEIATIPWLVDQQTERHIRIAARLAEIVGHPLAEYFRSQIDALDWVKSFTGDEPFEPVHIKHAFNATDTFGYSGDKQSFTISAGGISTGKTALIQAIKQDKQDKQ